MSKEIAPLVLFLLLWLGWVPAVLAKPRLVILTGQEPSALEQLAATELEAMLQRLFDVDVSVRTAPTGDNDAVLLVGTPSRSVHMNARRAFAVSIGLL